jgi:plastocyanin domain-containing protein
MTRKLVGSIVLGAWLVTGCGGGERAAQAPGDSPGPAAGAIAITVTENGFEPAEITVPRGEPVTLVVTRRTEKTCATEFVMKSHGINQPLPMNQAVTIAFTPTEPGELRFACGMDMIAGKVIVR